MTQGKLARSLPILFLSQKKSGPEADLLNKWYTKCVGYNAAHEAAAEHYQLLKRIFSGLLFLLPTTATVMLRRASEVPSPRAGCPVV